jgi:myo-inositol-1(or 4)-monophosphatase
MSAFDRELIVLTEALREAGRRALDIQARGAEITIKVDHSPVTSADLEIDRHLRAVLRDAFPEDGWLSEESPESEARLQAKRVWVVDPIDGTKYFIDRIPEFGISVALVEGGEVQVGAVFNPATDELFTAARGRGAWLNGVPMRVSAERRDRFILFGAPPAMRRGRLRPLEALVDLRPMGSIAYTLAQVAAGKADATVNTSLMHEWDIAAGVLLVTEAGGIVRDMRGAQFQFNKPDAKVHGVVAGRPEAAPHFQTWLQAVKPTRG